MSQNFSTSTNPEQIAELIRKGIATDLEALIKQELMSIVNPLISDLARNLAKETALKISVYDSYTDGEMRKAVNVHLQFNNEKVVYTADNKPGPTKIIQQQNGEYKIVPDSN
jgi:hypothetical protein